VESESFRLALAQINPVVGAVAENGKAVEAAIERARSEGAHLVLTPELCISGYPAEDLYLKHHFLEACHAEVARIAAGTKDVAALVGFPEPRAASAGAHIPDAPIPRIAYNSLALLRDGRVEATYRKHRLPNYAVFDERRYFEPGPEPLVVDVEGVPVGLTICEDIWAQGSPEADEAAAGGLA